MIRSSHWVDREEGQAGYKWSALGGILGGNIRVTNEWMTLKIVTQDMKMMMQDGDIKVGQDWKS